MDQYVREGYNDLDTILGILSRDEKYQQNYMNRFPAVERIRTENASRAAQGCHLDRTHCRSVCSPGGFVQAGLDSLPDGLWGTAQDVADWIVGEVSPRGDDRVVMARNYVNYDANQYVRAGWRSTA